MQKTTARPNEKKKPRESATKVESGSEAREPEQARPVEAAKASHHPMSETTPPGANRKAAPRVEQVMTRDARSVKPLETVQVAAQIMWDHDCGCVPVVDDDSRILSMLTDRDICMAACTQQKPLREIPVSTAMSREIFSCKPEDSLRDAEEMMKQKKVRRLPVTAPDGRLVGILSLKDIAMEAVRQRTQKEKRVSDDEVGETLAELCAPSAWPANPAP